MEVQDELGVVISEEPAGIRVILRGELDVATSPMLLRHLQDVFAQGCSRIVFDTKDLSFVDTTGLWLFITAQKRALAEGKTFSISSPPNNITELIEVSGLSGFFDLSD